MDWKPTKTEQQIERQIKGLEKAYDISMFGGATLGANSCYELSIMKTFIEERQSYISVNEEEDKQLFDAEKKAFDWLYKDIGEDLWIDEYYYESLHASLTQQLFHLPSKEAEECVTQFIKDHPEILDMYTKESLYEMAK